MRDKFVLNWKYTICCSTAHYWMKKSVDESFNIALIVNCNRDINHGPNIAYKCPFLHSELNNFHYLVWFPITELYDKHIQYFQSLDEAKQHADKILEEHNYVLMTEKLEILI
jgi:hypothetical protein